MATTVRLPIYGHGCGASPRRPSACRARVVVVLATQSPDSRGRGKRDNVSPPSAVNASGRGGATAMVPPPLELQQQRQRGGRGVAGMDMEGVLSSIDGCALEMQIPGAEHTLVLLRHGQSVWNLENRFTGWADIPLTEKGEDEATQAGKLMLERGFEFDVCYTSGLERAQHTADLCLANCYQHEIPTVHDWRLNERHYGALQGLVKDDPMLQRIYGEEQLVEWRRSYYERPPPMDPCHPLWAPPPVPETESLADCLLRVKQCWDDRIAPTVRSGKRVLVVAHANTIRALIKTVDGITDDDIRQVKIPNGAPIVYRLGKDLRPVDLADDLNFAGEYLVSPLNHRKVKDYSRCRFKLLRGIFKMMDRDGDGKLTQREVCSALVRLGSTFDSEFLNEEVEDMLREMNVEEDGKVTFEEFVRSHEIIDENVSFLTHFSLLD